MLIAIEFAPSIVGHQTVARVSLIPTSQDLQQQGKSYPSGLEMYDVVEFCPTDNSVLENHTCPHCHATYPARLVPPGLPFLFYVLLILFVVKYIHERSVLRFHLYDDKPYGAFRRKVHEVELRRLHTGSNKGTLHVLTFFARLAFLLFFYMFVIDLYIRHGGVLSTFGSKVYYALLLISGYVIPDLCLFAATKGDVFRTVKKGLTSKMGLIIAVLVIVVLVGLLLARARFSFDTVTSLLIFVLLAAIACLGALIRVFSTFDQHSIEVTAFKWLLLDTFILTTILVYAILSHSHSVDVTLIACVILLINLADWGFSAWFYFGTHKFTIQGRTKTIPVPGTV